MTKLGECEFCCTGALAWNIVPVETAATLRNF